MKKRSNLPKKETEQHIETFYSVEDLSARVEEYFLQQYQAKFANGDRETRQAIAEMLLSIAKDGFVYKSCLGVANSLLPQASEEEQAVLQKAIAVAADRNGEFEKGRDAHLRALALHRKTAGAVSSQVVADLNDLAWHFEREGDDVQATRCNEESLQVQKSLWGLDEGPDIATNYLLKGLIHKKRGEMDAAKAFLEKAQNLAMRVEGKPHRALHEIEWELGTLSFEKQDFHEAIFFFRRSLKMKIHYWGRKNQDLAPYLVASGIAYGGDRQPTKAKICLQQAVSLYFEEGLEADRLLFDALVLLGWNHRQAGQLKEAIASFQKLKKIWPAIDDIKPVEVARLYVDLGLALLTDGRLEEARKVVREGQRNVTRILARNPEYLQEEGSYIASLTTFVNRIGPELKKEETQLRKRLTAVSDTKTVIRDRDGELLAVLAGSPENAARTLISFSVHSFVIDGRDSQETSLSQGDLKKLTLRSARSQEQGGAKKTFTWSATECDLRVKSAGDCWMLEWKTIYEKTSPLRLQLDPKETALLKEALGI
ncbi:MAG: tetratricopeptide repeat protein [Coprothermobacterota bacterium]|jgi:tetratricopeptide (TPR) repeat protein|nr:tetratricopeptide repeat protein [Coprothermobacterota bacterium]